MRYVTVGRIQIKPGANPLPFLWQWLLAHLQALRSPGKVYASIYFQDLHTFWSMSAWDSLDAMLAYRKSDRYLRAVRLSQSRDASVDVRHWEAEAVPSWGVAMLSLAGVGNAWQPSSLAAHAATHAK